MTSKRIGSAPGQSERVSVCEDGGPFEGIPECDISSGLDNSVPLEYSGQPGDQRLTSTTPLMHLPLRLKYQRFELPLLSARTAAPAPETLSTCR